MAITEHITPDDLKSIGNLNVLARTVVEGMNTGLHRSPDKGASIEFKQHRPYVPGDDLRNLDWKVFAKSDRFYIREYEQETNLRATILLDCSGSMRGECMDRAQAFGAMLAEAARGMSGVSLRLFGFTDDTIYDAGDATRPAVSGLEADGGNNDAAALHYAASEARRSKRRAKLLVMISDGLPTECSVDALRGLVEDLSRREKMCCAQVAVRPLEEICFPHYVEVTDESFEVAVRQFGQIIARLVHRALSG